jgi:hypothetical protein
MTSPLSFIPGPIFEAVGAGAFAAGAGAGAGAGVDEVEAGAGAGELVELDEPMPKVPQPVATAATAATENRSFAFIPLLNEKEPIWHRCSGTAHYRWAQGNGSGVTAALLRRSRQHNRRLAARESSGRSDSGSRNRP